jgi:hypothetical protein
MPIAFFPSSRAAMASTNALSTPPEKQTSADPIERMLSESPASLFSMSDIVSATRFVTSPCPSCTEA